VVLGELSIDGITEKGTHEAIVTPAVWRAAQLDAGPRRRSADDYPLSHLAVCGTCGAGMIGGRSGGKENGGRKRRYRCSSRSGAGHASIVADALEQHVETAARGAVQRLRASASVEDGASEGERELAAMIRATIERVVVAPGRGVGVERLTFDYVGDDAERERIFSDAARRVL